LLAESELSGSSAGGWTPCSRDEARRNALRFFNDIELDAAVLGRWKRLIAYLVNHDLWWKPRVVPHGPAPWRASQVLQADAQKEEVRSLELPDRLDKERLKGWTEQARNGYEQAQSRIDGIQQRASFILGATGITTAGVLANSGLIFDREVLPSLGMQIAVGGLLVTATVALAVAAYAALEATMIMFELAQPNSPWQIERRIRDVSRKKESRYVLATILLAARRAEVIGDWKVRQVKRARRSFTAAILFVVLANLSLLVSGLFS
jgi:hypothetical protein